MFFWRRVAPQIPEEGLKPTATPGYTRNFRDLNDLVSRGKSFSGYERNPFYGLNQLPSFISPFSDEFMYEIKFLKTYLNIYLKWSR